MVRTHGRIVVGVSTDQLTVFGLVAIEVKSVADATSLEIQPGMTQLLYFALPMLFSIRHPIARSHFLDVLDHLLVETYRFGLYE